MSRYAVITGGLGFIGHALWRELVEHDYRVVVIDDLRFTNRNLLRARHNHCYRKLWHKGRADDLGLIYRNIESKDTIIYHLASHPNQAAVARDPYGACENIVGTTSKLAHFCAENKLRMVYVSSSMVYGNWTNTKAVEDQPLNPINMYGLYKKQAEEIVRTVLPGQHTIVRPSAVYGPLDSENRVIMKWTNAAMIGMPILVDDPDAILDFTYVDDIATGLMLAGQKRITDTFNITGGYGYTLLETAEMIKNLVNSDSEIVIGPGLDKGMPRRGVLDISKAKNRLGYSPAITLSHGLNVVATWLGI